jgi:hypothetical protein
VADEATIRDFAKYKKITADLTDPRKTNDEAAKQLIATGKPIYWAHRQHPLRRDGSVEMLMELATGSRSKSRRSSSRSATTSSSSSRRRRKWMATIGRWTTSARFERASRSRRWSTGAKYVAHDNNRDGIGKG